MVLFMVLFSSFSFLFFCVCVCVCVFVCFELCFLSWNCKMKFHNLIFFVLFPWRLKVFLSNFIVVSYINLNFTIFAVFDFVLYFSLIDFMVIHTEQNVCVVSRLFFFWSSSLAIVLNFTGNGPQGALRYFAPCYVHIFIIIMQYVNLEWIF